jgi:hypothetical protein
LFRRVRELAAHRAGSYSRIHVNTPSAKRKLR